MPPVQARTCEVCGKPKGVTWHRMQNPDGSTRVVMAHPICFTKFRAAAGLVRIPRRFY
jgi:hypothetical protein